MYVQYYAIIVYAPRILFSKFMLWYVFSKSRCSMIFKGSWPQYRSSIQAIRFFLYQLPFISEIQFPRSYHVHILYIDWCILWKEAMWKTNIAWYCMSYTTLLLEDICGCVIIYASTLTLDIDKWSRLTIQKTFEKK